MGRMLPQESSGYASPRCKKSCLNKLLADLAQEDFRDVAADIKQVRSNYHQILQAKGLGRFKQNRAASVSLTGCYFSIFGVLRLRRLLQTSFQIIDEKDSPKRDFVRQRAVLLSILSAAWIGNLSERVPIGIHHIRGPQSLTILDESYTVHRERTGSRRGIP